MLAEGNHDLKNFHLGFHGTKEEVDMAIAGWNAHRMYYDAVDDETRGYLLKLFPPDYESNKGWIFRDQLTRGRQVSTGKA